MNLIEFSVTNFRSITKAHKIYLQDFTVLVGKNNEGKSNLLRALNIAMQSIMSNTYDKDEQYPFSREAHYIWKRDFPIQLQNRSRGLESIFKLTFKLNSSELEDFRSNIKIRGNEIIPITIKIGKDNEPKVLIPKKGSPAYKKNSNAITNFIMHRISFNYIPAVRTDSMALNNLQNVIEMEIKSLENNTEYREALRKLNDLRQSTLDDIADKLLNPMKVFLPTLNSIHIEENINEYWLPFNYLNHRYDVILDDGVATSIKNKGDGIKSLVTLAILKEREQQPGASIIAIEEPESHLHSGAIHSLVDVINGLALKNQVIITTHNPLFVQQNNINKNVIIDNGTARIAKNIAEIRTMLGVWPSDNLRNSRFVLVVEGEDDKICLSKILPLFSKKIADALSTNKLIIKPLGGASNLSHDLNDLKQTLCNYVVLLDNDKAGNDAAKKAKEHGLLDDSILRQTNCQGSPESEIEDCINPNVYINLLESKYNIVIKDNKFFRSNKKWSDRMKAVFLDQGIKWSDATEKNVKECVATSIPHNGNLDDILISQKSGFLIGLRIAIEKMLSVDE